MNVTEIVDKLLPLTQSDMKCGFDKARKLQARSKMITLINDYKEGKKITLPFEVFKLLQ